MKTPRSTVIAERLIVLLCVASFIGFFSYELGRYVEYRQCLATTIKQEMKKLNVHTMSKQSQRAWARYLAVQG